MMHSVSTSFRSAPHMQSYLTRRLQGLRSKALRICRAVRVETGANLVEFALASIILFTLVFGVIAICLALYTYNVVAEAAREGSRYAMVRGSACNSFANCKVTRAQLETYVQSINWPGIDSSLLTIPTMSLPDGNNNPGSRVAVTVNYTFPLVIPFVPRRTLTMSSTSQVVISQ